MASRVAAIHVLEHLWRWEAEAVLTEWSRLLEPGGQLILELPCMDKVFQYIHDLPPGPVPIRCQMTSWAFWGDPRYEDPSMTHKWGYFRAELMELMTQVGLEQVQEEPTRYHLKQRDMRITGRKPLLGQRKDHV